MDLNLLSEGKDPMGAAIYDYLKYGKAGRLRVFSSQFDEDEIPVAGLYIRIDAGTGTDCLAAGNG